MILLGESAHPSNGAQATSSSRCAVIPAAPEPGNCRFAGRGEQMVPVGCRAATPAHTLLFPHPCRRCDLAIFGWKHQGEGDNKPGKIGRPCQTGGPSLWDGTSPAAVRWLARPSQRRLKYTNPLGASLPCFLSLSSPTRSLRNPDFLVNSIRLTTPTNKHSCFNSLYDKLPATENTRRVHNLIPRTKPPK